MDTADIDDATKQARQRFDSFTAAQVIERAPRLSVNGLQQVLIYEQQTKARSTVVDAVEQELRRRAHSEPHAGVQDGSAFGSNGRGPLRLPPKPQTPQRQVRLSRARSATAITP